jgi:O-acetyl-ADP-ribose deacetylase (regulator of RNase III)
MSFKVILVDVNPKMVDAWKSTFEEEPDVQIVQGSLLDQQVSAWVSPTNSRAHMGGGVDKLIRQHLGDRIQAKVQKEIQRLYLGVMPIGCATCVPTDLTMPRFLISTPVMGPTSDNVGDTLNVALACAAAFQAAHLQNRREPNSIETLALPGLGTKAGGVPVEICADLMWTAYSLLQRCQFPDYFGLRSALEHQLGDLGPMSSKTKPKKSAAPSAPGTPTTPATPSAPPTLSVKKADFDFDDAT